MKCLMSFLKFDEESRAAQSEIEKIGKEMDEILQKHQKNKKAIEFANQGITEARILEFHI